MRRWRTSAVVVAVLLVLVGGVLLTLREAQRDACLAGPGFDRYDGLRLEQAEQRAARDGYVVRVVGRDGRCLDRTDDRRQDRVNVYLEGDRVARAGIF